MKINDFHGFVLLNYIIQSYPKLTFNPLSFWVYDMTKYLQVPCTGSAAECPRRRTAEPAGFHHGHRGARHLVGKQDTIHFHLAPRKCRHLVRQENVDIQLGSLLGILEMGHMFSHVFIKYSLFDVFDVGLSAPRFEKRKCILQYMFPSKKEHQKCRQHHERS